MQLSLRVECVVNSAPCWKRTLRTLAIVHLLSRTGGRRNLLGMRVLLDACSVVRMTDVQACVPAARVPELTLGTPDLPTAKFVSWEQGLTGN